MNPDLCNYLSKPVAHFVPSLVLINIVFAIIAVICDFHFNIKIPEIVKIYIQLVYIVGHLYLVYTVGCKPPKISP
jgi:hypothetical protein